MKKIFLCAISNISSGSCSEDCKFCTQSSKYSTNIDKYSKKDIDKIVEEAKIAKSFGALGFCLVTSGKGLNRSTLKYMIEVTEKVKKEIPSLNLIACNGTASKDQLKDLKSAGISSYNHNLETSENFYPQICSTHSWRERFETCENVKNVGLELCSGGIVGMGETESDRENFFKSLLELDPTSIPINFYHHNKALPLKENPLSIKEGLEIIYDLREKFSGRLMIAGGRSSFFGDREDEIFEAGANSIVIGNYLTTKGQDSHKDLEMLKRLNLEIARNC
jgi:biotin synthase